MTGVNEIWREFKQSGSTNAFKRLYDACYDVLYRYASFYIDSLDAEEVVLDLMLYLWTNRGSIEIHTSVESYLRSSIHNRCLNKLRGRVPTISLEFVAEFGTADMEQRRITEEDISIVVWEAMKTLSPKCRQIFEMSRNEGLKNSEIDSNMRLSANTLEAYITNSLNHIRIFAKNNLIMLIFLGL